MITGLLLAVSLVLFLVPLAWYVAGGEYHWWLVAVMWVGIVGLIVLINLEASHDCS